MRDGLLDTINGFHAALAQFNAGQYENDADSDAAAQRTFRPWLAKLQQWDAPAASLEAAVAAIRLAADEDKAFMGSPTVPVMLRSALAYLGTEGDARRAGAPARKIDLHDVQIDVTNLFRLLDTIVDQIMEMDHGEGVGRNRELDRIGSLVWVARDMADRMQDAIDRNFDAIGRTNVAASEPVDSGGN